MAAFVVVACGETTDPSAPPDPSNWDEAEEKAEDQTVRWWMFGGDERINLFVDQFVVPAADELEVSLERVPVADTGDAVQRVLAEQRAGSETGSIDLIWINGENFALGKRTDLWMENWAERLPNSSHVDWDDSTINEDFGLPVDGQESPWGRAAFVFAHNPEHAPEPPGNFDELAAYAEGHPGRVTYPAPPDFTGSAFVRLAVQSLGEDEAFRLLRQMKPFLWQEGDTYPGSEAELNRLFGNGHVDFAMSYNPGFVAAEVSRGIFSPSTRPFIMATGTLHNVSYVTIPREALSPAGAMVVANLLLEPRLQALQADPEVLGMPTVLAIETLSPEEQSRLSEAAEASPYLLADLGPSIRELSPERVSEIEERWRQEVLR